jgi:1-acyl-sn-glycerol-3-phosphate acyltransferase
VAIFPEGLRTWGRTVVPFKKSAFTLAAEADVPIVLVTIVDADTLLDERIKFSRPGTVRVAIGPEFRIADTSRTAIQEAAREARNLIQQRIDELRH